MSNSKNKAITSYCRLCCNENYHETLHLEDVTSDDPDYHYAIHYSIIKCMGCHTISFREDFHDYEQSYPIEYDQWEHPIRTTIYPPILFNHKYLENNWQIPDDIRTVYFEAINALKAKCHLLAGAGFRAIIEAICIDKLIKGRNLEIKINNLAKDGLITKKECDRLHSIRFIGNDSIHEMKVPDEKQLKVVLNIVEHLIRNLYIIDSEVDSALERPINHYEDFKKLLSKKIKSYISGDEVPLVKLLDKDVRRVKDNFIEFEKELVNEINGGKFKTLSIGDLKQFSGSKNNVQHYIVIKTT